MDQNKQLLKQLSQGKSGQPEKKSAVSRLMESAKNIPGVEAIRKTAKNTNTKQVVDVAIFTVGIYLMYKFGQAVAETIDNQMPTEKSMMDMMRSMQGGPGMPPPPM
ncbi:MAG: hypothetical protein ACK56F_19450 [bacterium]|jgi:hypothetical protein